MEELGYGSATRLPNHFKADNLSGKRAIADSVRTGLCLVQSEARCSA